MKPQSKLSQQQQQEQVQTGAHAQETRQQAGQEFASAEELLRFDAAQTPVPPEIAQRLMQSTGNAAPPARRSWWRNLLGQ
jgi:hypothetical protein